MALPCVFVRWTHDHMQARNTYENIVSDFKMSQQQTNAFVHLCDQ